MELNIESPEPLESSEPQETQEVSQETTQDNRPEGWEQVDFTPDQQKRFDRVYKQLKDNERNIKEYRQLVREQSEAISHLQQTTGQVVNHIVEDKFAQKESQLIADQKSAFESGDLDKYNKVTRELGKLDIQREQAQNKPQPVQPQGPIAAQDVVNEAVRDGEITPQDANVYRTWATERDEFGQPVRPWVNEADVRGSRAAYIGAAVFNDPNMSDKSFAEKLMEIDRLMGTQRKSSQSVMSSSGNLTRPNKISNIKLSPEIERMAIHTKFAGPGKSEAEHIEAYRKQVATAKGVRK